VVLVTVGTGEEVDGAGAGVVAGGASVGVGDAAAGWVAGCGAGWPAAGWVVAAPPVTAGWLAFVPAGAALRVPMARRGFWACRAACDGTAVALAGPAGGVVWALAAGAGAVRANAIAKPTVASAPSCVVRHVRRPSRRKPASRAPAGESS
jgi:hypothetical protein